MREFRQSIFPSAASVPIARIDQVNAGIASLLRQMITSRFVFLLIDPSTLGRLCLQWSLLNVDQRTLHCISKSVKCLK